MSALPTDPKSLPSSEACRLWVKASASMALAWPSDSFRELGRLALLAGLDRVEILEVGRGRVQRELVGQQVVAGIAVGDVADLTAASELRHVVEEDDLHRGPAVLTRP